MALITSQSGLNQGSEITINVNTKQLTLNTAGNLSDDGVTGQALYSFLKEEWKSDSSLIPYPFPMVSITPEQFEFIEGWVPQGDTTRNLIRTAGWREINDADNIEREYMGIISLGSIESSNTPYYAFSSDSSKTDFDFSGPINQAIQTFGDGSNGGFDKRSDVLTVYIRSQGNLYGSSTSSSIGLPSLNYIANRFPLAEAADTKITASDSTISSSGPYNGMSITYGAVTRDIGGVNYNFDVVVDGNNGTTQQIYEFVQWSLRQATDIDDSGSTVIGQLADNLMGFQGDTLGTTQGVAIDSFQSGDRNNVVFQDTGGTNRTFPFLATGSISFNSNLVNDAGAIYRMFFADGFGTASALLVNNNAGSPISGSIGGNGNIGFDFDYDGNVQGGRSSATDAEVVVVAIGLDTAQYVSATATIVRSGGQGISLVAPLERNYNS